MPTTAEGGSLDKLRGDIEQFVKSLRRPVVVEDEVEPL